MSLLENGFEIIDDFISEHWSQTILDDLKFSNIPTDQSGTRGIDKKLPSLADYLKTNEFKQKMNPFISPDTRLVRAILFNKSPESNWFVTWHQDKTVAVSSRFEEAGWRAWSVKDGCLHVQPPLDVLKTMVTVRIHLDAASNENGCLKVIPGSHNLGILTPEEVEEVVSRSEVYFCEAQARSALVMRPHLLHASSKSLFPENRRVIHLEFSDWKLPVGVEWG